MMVWYVFPNVYCKFIGSLKEIKIIKSLFCSLSNFLHYLYLKAFITYIYTKKKIYKILRKDLMAKW